MKRGGRRKGLRFVSGCQTPSARGGAARRFTHRLSTSKKSHGNHSVKYPGQISSHRSSVPFGF